MGLLGVQLDSTQIEIPEEIAHIEVYHGILKKELFNRLDDQCFGDIEHVLNGMSSFKIIEGYMTY